MKKTIVLAAATILFLALYGRIALADMRPYTWQYGYMTPVKGEIELEWWGEFQDKVDRTAFLPLLEVEYGITDHWVAEVSGSGIKDGSDTWKFDEVKVEQRYRLFEPGTLPIDTTLYFEYKHSFTEDVHTIEGKVILSKDFGNLNATVNLIVEQDLKSLAPTEYEYTAGLSYPVSRRVKPAIEAFGTSVGSRFEQYIGPSVMIDLGKVWVNAGAAFGLTPESDHMRARVIISHELNVF